MPRKEKGAEQKLHDLIWTNLRALLAWKAGTLLLNVGGKHNLPENPVER